MKPLLPEWVGRVAYGIGLAVVVVAVAVWLVQAYSSSRECEERGGVPVYGRCAQPMPEKP